MAAPLALAQMGASLLGKSGGSSVMGIGSNLVGSIFSGFGAKKKAKSQQRALEAAMGRVNEFTDNTQRESERLRDWKMSTLEQSDNVFDRLGGFIFGDSLDSMRKSQSDFSDLAAGNFGGFMDAYRSSQADINAQAKGGPVGFGQNLSAQNAMNFRLKGLEASQSLGGFFQQAGTQLLNTEFGISDQDFQLRTQLEQQRVNQLNEMSMQHAGLKGTTAAAAGNVFHTMGQGYANYGALQHRQGMGLLQTDLMRTQQSGLQGLMGGGGGSGFGPVYHEGKGTWIGGNVPAGDYNLASVYADIGADPFRNAVTAFGNSF